MITIYAMNSSGSATITANCEGYTATCEVTISSLMLDKNEVTLTSGQMENITATLTETEGIINWTSSNTNIATLSSKTGNSVTVTGISIGTSIITAECNGFSATCRVIIPGNITDTNLQIGDYVNYTPTSGTYSVSADISGAESTQDFSTEANLQWRVLSKNGNQIELISSKQTTNQLNLFGSNGYNYGVDILNELCKSCYSNSGIGATARSINIEDLCRLTNITPEIGATYTWTQYPKILDNANCKENGSLGIPGGTSNTEISGDIEGNISLTYIYYNVRQYVDTNYLLQTTGTGARYFLASRDSNSSNLLCFVSFTGNMNLFMQSPTGSIRPVVTITL